jgi:hypothetical protein
MLAFFFGSFAMLSVSFIIFDLFLLGFYFILVTTTCFGATTGYVNFT